MSVHRLPVLYPRNRWATHRATGCSYRGRGLEQEGPVAHYSAEMMPELIASTVRCPGWTIR